MHPKWLRGGPPEAFLMPLRDLGLQVLEFTLAPASPDWPATDALIGFCRRLRFRVSFHAPHKGRYKIAGFSGSERERIQRHFEPAISYAAAIAEKDGPVTLVIHGAGGKGARESLRDDTEAFLAWLRRRAPRLRPALELRVREPGVVKVGDSKADLLSFLSQCLVPHVGICWDLGHDARNDEVPPMPDFIDRVTHVHVHDLSPEGEDHYPLVFGRAPYRDALRKLFVAGYRGALVLEVNGDLVGRIAAGLDVPPMGILTESFRRITAGFAL